MISDNSMQPYTYTIERCIDELIDDCSGCGELEVVISYTFRCHMVNSPRCIDSTFIEKQVWFQSGERLVRLWWELRGTFDDNFNVIHIRSGATGVLLAKGTAHTTERGILF